MNFKRYPTGMSDKEQMTLHVDAWRLFDFKFNTEDNSSFVINTFQDWSLDYSCYKLLDLNFTHVKFKEKIWITDDVLKILTHFGDYRRYDLPSDVIPVIDTNRTLYIGRTEHAIVTGKTYCRYDRYGNLTYVNSCKDTDKCVQDFLAKQKSCLIARLYSPELFTYKIE